MYQCSAPRTHTPLSPTHMSDLPLLSCHRRLVRLGPPPPLPPRLPRAPIAAARASLRRHQPPSPNASADLLPIKLLSQRRCLHARAALHRLDAPDRPTIAPGLRPSSTSTPVSIPHPARVTLHRQDVPDRPATTPRPCPSSTSTLASIPLARLAHLCSSAPLPPPP
jgi:hypothetical protein